MGNDRFTAGVFEEILSGKASLKAGDKGQPVEALQQALGDMGFPMMTLKGGTAVSAVDGAFGGQTATALRNFQVHARKHQPDVTANGVLDQATMRALAVLAPEPGKKAWDEGQPTHAPAPCWNGDKSRMLRVVVVKDEYRTFLYDTNAKCIGILPNAHGAPNSTTDLGLKKVRTKLDETGAKRTGNELWNAEKAFGKRIIDLIWEDGRPSGEELHGTYDYQNMGKQASHGCVRHYNEDIITIFNSIKVGDLVAIVDSVDDDRLRI